MRLRRAIGFTVGAALPVWVALRGGGFDVVARHEMALVVWGAIAAGFAAGVLPRGRPDRDLLVPAVAIGGLVAWTALSLTWTESDERTIEELTRLLGYVGLAVAAWAGLNRYTFRAAAGGLSTAALAIAALAVASRLAPSAFPVDELAVTFDTDRLSYPFDYWNAVAACGSIAIAVGLCWSAHAQRELTRAIALALVPVAGLAVYLTYSRGGIVSSLVAVVAAIGFSRNRWTVVAHAVVAAAAFGVAVLSVRANTAIADATGGEGGAAVAIVLVGMGVVCGITTVVSSRLDVDRLQLPRAWGRPLAALTVLVALVAGGGLAASGLAAEGWERFVNDDVAGGAVGTERLASAGGDRDEIWGSAIDALRDDPLNGVGPGAFEYWWYRDEAATIPVVDGHSLYFETAAELGAPGLLLLLAAFGGLAYAAVRARVYLRRTADIGGSAAMTAAFAVFAVHAGIDWLWEYPALVALGLGAVAIAIAGGSERLSDRRRPQWAFAGAAAVVAILQIPGLVGAERQRDSELALADRNFEAALAQADAAVEAEPWAADARAQRALVHESDGDLSAAREDLLAARDREPTNWLWAAQLARVERSLGNTEAAAAADRLVARLNRIDG